MSYYSEIWQVMQHTGRRRSRSHQIAWLVSAGEEPNTRMGSQSTKHSQIDHKLARQASKRSRGGGIKGAVVANICDLGLYFSLNDEVPVTCSTSIESGISTWSTVPRNPSSMVVPGVGSGLPSYCKRRDIAKSKYMHLPCCDIVACSFQHRCAMLAEQWTKYSCKG